MSGRTHTLVRIDHRAFALDQGRVTARWRLEALDAFTWARPLNLNPVWPLYCSEPDHDTLVVRREIASSTSLKHRSANAALDHITRAPTASRFADLTNQLEANPMVRIPSKVAQ